MPEILLTHVVPARNDNYLGNFKHRLELMLNYNCGNAVRAGFAAEYEVLVVDYNSDTPLREALNLTEEARRCTRFLEVSPELLRERNIQGPKINLSLCFNIAARRAAGRMVMLGPADILIPEAAMRALFRLLQQGIYCGIPLEECVLGMERFLIPWQSTDRLTLDNLERYLTMHATAMRLEDRVPGVSCGEGGMLLSKKALMELKGCNEQYGGWGTQDIELSLKAMQRRPQVKLTHAGVFCYDMQSSPVARQSIRVEKQDFPLDEQGNADDWGLRDVALEKKEAIACPHVNNFKPDPLPPYNQTLAPSSLRQGRKILQIIAALCDKALRIPRIDSMLHGWCLSFFAGKSLCRFVASQRWQFLFARLAIQILAQRWVTAGAGSPQFYLSKKFGEPQQVHAYLNFALSRNIHRSRNSWDLEAASSLLAVIATLGSRPPRRFFYAAAQHDNFFTARAAVLADPTMDITGFVPCRDMLRDWNKDGFAGYFHSLSGELSTAFTRLKNGPFIGEPYQTFFLDLFFLREIADNLGALLEPLMDDSCSIICKGDDAAIASTQTQFEAMRFDVIGRLPGVMILRR